MSDRRDFDEFVVTRSSRLLRTAYLLTRDWALAEDLLQTALAKSWFASGRLGDDPEPWSFLVSIRCDKDMPESRMVSAEINGNPLMAGRCSGGVSTAGPAYGTEQARAESLGVRLGEPATVQVRVVAFTLDRKRRRKSSPSIAVRWRTTASGSRCTRR
jgi:hypothetical protein